MVVPISTDVLAKKNAIMIPAFSVLFSSKVTLIINVVTPIFINEPLRVMIDFESHVSDDMTVLHNFVKSSRRLQTIKVLLDDQVKS